MTQLVYNGKDWRCYVDWSTDEPVLELTPATDQVVFQGDVLSLFCRVHKSDHHVRWFHDGRPFFADRRSGELQQSYRDPAHHGDIISAIRLERLRPRHSGNWTCEARTSLGRSTRFAQFQLLLLSLFFGNSVPVSYTHLTLPTKRIV